MTPPLFAIDAPVYIFRSYFALEGRWQSRDGMATEAVYGFAAFLIRLLGAERPAYIAAAFDESLGSGFRHQLWPGYKASRALPDENLIYQFQGCRDVAAALGVGCFGCKRYEADDYLASFAAAAARDQKVFVISRDKDLTQLIDRHVSCWDYGYGDPVTLERFEADRGFNPVLMPDWLALIGDPGDDIPGVPGVGARTATAIVSTLGAVENWLDQPERLSAVEIRGSAKLAERIAPYRDQILLAKRLTTLNSGICAAPSLAEMARAGFDRHRAEEVFAHYGLQGLNKRLEQLSP